jgi:hypothetical protein
VNAERLGSYRIEQDFYFSEATPLPIWRGPVPIISVVGSGELLLDDATTVDWALARTIVRALEASDGDDASESVTPPKLPA